MNPGVGVPVSDNYQPNGSLPLWSPGGEEMHARALYPILPAGMSGSMIQHPGNYSGGDIRPSGSYRYDPEHNMARTPKRRQKSNSRRAQKSSKHDADIQSNLTSDTRSCIPLPHPYLVPQAPSTSSQQLSHPTHSSLTTSAVTSVAPAMPTSNAQLPVVPTIVSTHTAGSSSSEGNPPIPWTDDEWNHIVNLVDDLNNERAQTSQQAPPVPQDGVLSPDNVPISYYQVTSPTDQQTQATTTQELELTRTTQQAPPQVAERVVPSLCNNDSKEQSLPVTTSAPHPAPHPGISSSENCNRTSAAAATQGLVTSQGSNSTHKPDQQLECAGPSDQIRNGNDGCHSNIPMAARDRSLSPSQENPMDLIEKLVHDGSDLFGEVLKPLRQHFCRKRKFTAVLENETDDESLPTPKNARRETGSRDESLMPLILLTCMHNMKVERDTIEELKEGQKAVYRQLKNISEQLETLSGRQQVKMENSIKTEAQDSCMGGTLQDESNGIRREDCCWNGENLLEIKSQYPCKYALRLLEKLFPAEERVGKCYRRSKGPRSANKPLLDEKRVKILEDCIKFRFGLKEFSACEDDLVQKCNQKCLDAKKKVNIKSE